LALLHHSQALAAEPVRVFILAGQSNMEGHGQIPMNPDRNSGKGSLEYGVQHTADVARLGLQDGNGSWRERDDVWMTVRENSRRATA
jgi:alpha-galactosidase